MPIMFRGLLRYSDVGLLLLRFMVAAVFFTSGLSHLKDPVGRSKSIGASPAFTRFLGNAEVLGSLGVALADATRRHRPDPHHARGDPEEDLRVEVGVLGRARVRLALMISCCS
jgi:hypothetical protein